ncbi:hypothetical protein Tco_1094142 [Tanacetum coccineum]|uniref:Uncharacterized protein n=1 Tax=Tanacetum coccineum TaxID=301880 RepID=A0ABQ5IG13_9ASTR
MTTPRPSVTPRAGVLIPFIILFDSDDEVTTLLVRPAPPSPDYVAASPDYSPDSDLDSDLSKDDSPGQDQTETAESLPTQITLTSVVHLPPPSLFPSSSSPPPSLLPSSSSPPPLLLPSSSLPPPSLLPSSSLPPPSLLPSSSSPPPSLLPSSSSSPPPSLLSSSSRKRSRSPSPLPSLTVPLPPPAVPLPPPAVPLPPTVVPPEHIESVGDDVKTLHARLTFDEQGSVTLRAKVESLEQHDVVTSESLRIARGGITRLQLQAIVHTLKAVMTEQEVEALHARAEAVEQRAEALQASLGAAQMDIKDLIESSRTDRLEMAELQSRAHDIKASF